VKIYDITAVDYKTPSYIKDYINGLDWQEIPYNFSPSITRWQYQFTHQGIEVYFNRYTGIWSFAPEDQTIHPDDLESLDFLQYLTEHIWLGNTIEYQATESEIGWLKFVGDRYMITDYLNEHREGNLLLIDHQVRDLMEETDGIPPMLSKETILFDLLTRI
jgi:hypothetical protein